MEPESHRLPLATKVINIGLILLAAVAAAGSILPPWPVLSRMYMGRSTPIEHFIQAVFGYPANQGSTWVWLGDVPFGVRIVTMLPVAVQVIALSALVVLTIRLLTAVSRGAALQTHARRSLIGLGVVGIGGGLMQFVIGAVAWEVGHQWFAPNEGDLGPSAAALYNQFPFPQWPLILILIGILAIALNVAFRAGAQFEQELEGVV